MKKKATHVDYYAVLNVSKSATTQEIELAYRKLVRIRHPDKKKKERAEAEARMKLVNIAYDILHDPRKRSNYDAGGDAQELDQGGFSFDPFQGFEQGQEVVIEGDFPDPFDFLFGGQGGGAGQRIEFQDGGEFKFDFGF